MPREERPRVNLKRVHSIQFNPELRTHWRFQRKFHLKLHFSLAIHAKNSVGRIEVTDSGVYINT